MTAAELRELLLPSDLVIPDEVNFRVVDKCVPIHTVSNYFLLQISQYTIPLDQLTGVLQTDLVMPVTKSDQMVRLVNRTFYTIG